MARKGSTRHQCTVSHTLSPKHTYHNHKCATGVQMRGRAHTPAWPRPRHRCAAAAPLSARGPGVSPLAAAAAAATQWPATPATPAKFPPAGWRGAGVGGKTKKRGAEVKGEKGVELGIHTYRSCSVLASKLEGVPERLVPRACWCPFFRPYRLFPLILGVKGQLWAFTARLVGMRRPCRGHRDPGWWRLSASSSRAAAALLPSLVTPRIPLLPPGRRHLGAG